MKVYARYFEENQLGFRRDTILQFGGSWDLIGSIILINPGSAKPSDIPIPSEVLKQLLSISQTDDADSWKEFSIDPTMWQIERLFNGYFIGQNKPLNGVIQLFNLFNLRNANLYEALEQFKKTSNSNIISIKNDITRTEGKPIYFGWGNTGKHQLKDIAKNVFEKAPPQPYLNDKFEDNSFYHPRYLQMGYRKNGNVIKTLHDFYNQNKEYVWDGVVKETKKINSGLVRENFEKSLSSKIDSTGITLKKYSSTIRLFFHDKENNELEFVITSTGKGYTAIRFKPNSPVIKDNSIDYITIGTDFGFDIIEDYKNDKNGKWFCRQYLKNFNMEEDALANQLIDFCQQILSL